MNDPHRQFPQQRWSQVNYTRHCYAIIHIKWFYAHRLICENTGQAIYLSITMFQVKCLNSWVFPCTISDMALFFIPTLSTIQTLHKFHYLTRIVLAMKITTDTAHFHPRNLMRNASFESFTHELNEKNARVGNMAMAITNTSLILNMVQIILSR